MLLLPIILQAQNVTIRAVNQPAAIVFRSIVEQTGMNFVYSSELLKDMKVSVTVKDKSLKHTLSEIFKGSDIEYRIKGKNVILTRRQPKKKEDKKVAKRQNVTLYPSSITVPKMLEEVVVVSRLEAPAVETAEIGAKKLTAQEIINTPVMFGESDVIKALQMQPGISEGQEGLAGMNVHGGNADENLCMLDNVPLYQVNHFAGLFSAFNAEAIRYIDFFKSSIPAKYDGRLSSYLDVRTKNGNPDGHHGSAKLGLTSGSFNIDGPIGRRTTYSVALRRSWFDVLSIPMLAIINSSSDDEKIRFRYAFMDLNAKVTHRFSNNATAFASVYFGNDVLKTGSSDKEQPQTGWYDDDKADFNWGNLVAQTGLNYKFKPEMSAEFTAAYTRYFSGMTHDWLSKETTGENTVESHSVTKTRNNINDWIFRADFDWRPGDNNRVRFGGGYTLHSFLPARTNRNYTVGTTQIVTRDSTWTYTANEANAYIEDDWRINDHFRTNAGLHLSLFNIDGKTNYGIAPRLSLSYRPNEHWAVKAAYARTNQYVHQLSQTYLSLPTDQWVPITGKFRPQNADKVSLGLYWRSDNRMFAASIEGYYKWMKHLIDYKDNYQFLPPSTHWEDKLTQGKGRSYGIELIARKEKGKITGWAGYTLSWNDRQFTEINKGRRFPAKFDNRHKFNIVVNWKVRSKVELTGSWTYMTGNRITVSFENYQVISPQYTGHYLPMPGNSLTPPYMSSNGLDYYTERNNFQLPAYHRLDLGINIYRPKKKERMGIWNISIYNVYSYMAPVSIRKGWWYGENCFHTLGVIPIIPSVSYTYKF